MSSRQDAGTAANASRRRQAGFLHTPKFLVFVVNLPEYRATDGDAASSYIAAHLGVDVTDIELLNDLAAAAEPDVLRDGS
jgi:hypothetical protein